MVPRIRKTIGKLTLAAATQIRTGGIRHRMPRMRLTARVTCGINSLSASPGTRAGPSCCHPRGGGGPGELRCQWIPAFAGMTGSSLIYGPTDWGTGR